jgi:hypothetical protein
MSAGWVGFISGLIMGGLFGMLILALCVVSRQCDRDETKPPRLPR